jgi:hypothetical protein
MKRESENRVEQRRVCLSVRARRKSEMPAADSNLVVVEMM